MTRRIYVVIALLAALGASADAYAAHHMHARMTHVHGWHRAYVVCDHMAEDSAAHVRLVRYSHDLIVYRCDRGGY